MGTDISFFIEARTDEHSPWFLFYLSPLHWHPAWKALRARLDFDESEARNIAKEREHLLFSMLSNVRGENPFARKNIKETSLLRSFQNEAKEFDKNAISFPAKEMIAEYRPFSVSAFDFHTLNAIENALKSDCFNSHIDQKDAAHLYARFKKAVEDIADIVLGGNDIPSILSAPILRLPQESTNPEELHDAQFDFFSARGNDASAHETLTMLAHLAQGKTFKNTNKRVVIHYDQ